LPFILTYPATSSIHTLSLHDALPIFVERKLGVHVLYKRVDNHWRQTPEYKELEFRWVPEGVTRLATLLTEEVHIADVERALQKRSEEHTSELQSPDHLVCRLLLEKNK